MTAALQGDEWSAARPSRTLPPGKTRYPFSRRLGGPQGRSGRAENLVPTGVRSQTVQTVVSRYTDWATRLTNPVLVEPNYRIQTGAESPTFQQYSEQFLQYWQPVTERTVPRIFHRSIRGDLWWFNDNIFGNLCFWISEVPWKLTRQASYV